MSSRLLEEGALALRYRAAATMPDRPPVRQRRLRSRISEVVAMAGPSRGTTDPQEANSGCRSPSARRAPDKMTIGVTCEDAGKADHRSRSAVARELFQAG